MNTRPRLVTWNIATIDGRIAISPAVPSWLDERWAPITKADFATVDILALHDTNVHIEGSNSFVAREAEPAEFPAVQSSANLHVDFLPEPVMSTSEKWMAVIDSRGRVPWTLTESGGTHLLILVSRATPDSYLAFLRERDIPYLVAGDGRVDLSVALQRLGQTFGVHTIVSDAGGVLNGAFLREGLVDEIDLQVLPVVAGLPNAPSIFEGYGGSEERRPLRLKLLHQETRPDGTLMLRFAPDVELT